VGSNKEFMQMHIPHLSKLITDNLLEVIDKSEIILVTQKDKKISSMIEKYPGKIFIDVVRVVEKSSSGNYQGICW
jgi:GDP-mannose 6-dehydrogenase